MIKIVITLKTIVIAEVNSEVLHMQFRTSYTSRKFSGFLQYIQLRLPFWLKIATKTISRRIQLTRKKYLEIKILFSSNNKQS